MILNGSVLTITRGGIRHIRLLMLMQKQERPILLLMSGLILLYTMEEIIFTTQKMERALSGPQREMDGGIYT